ncbi:hypothetical protein N8314_00790 [Akkermansiaceae bacterium]|nr:hypothetical protein [Akkermansiaceae bacterium]
MAIIKSATSANTSTYTLLEDDVYPARIVKVVFLGSQPQKPYKGKEKPDAVMARVTYEIIGEVITQTRDGESKELVAQISEKLTVPRGGQTMGKMANLLKTVIGREETFADTDDYKQLLNKEVNVQIDKYTSTHGTFNGVKSVTALGNKAKANLEEAQLGQEFFCPYTNSDEMKLLWSQLPPWQQDIIKSASDKDYIPAVVEAWPTEEVKADEEIKKGDEF